MNAPECVGCLLAVFASTTCNSCLFLSIPSYRLAFRLCFSLPATFALLPLSFFYFLGLVLVHKCLLDYATVFALTLWFSFYFLCLAAIAHLVAVPATEDIGCGDLSPSFDCDFICQYFDFFLLPLFYSFSYIRVCILVTIEGGILPGGVSITCAVFFASFYYFFFPVRF